MKRIILFAVILAVLLPSFGCREKDDDLRVILIGMDGLRWQEVFGGVDQAVLDCGSIISGDVRKDYWEESREARRKALMPFTWDFIANNGVIAGDRENGSFVSVTNKMWFSYPGWSEMTCGYPDDEFITSNGAGPNRNFSFLEFANMTEKYKGSVLAYGSWLCFYDIINYRRAGFPVNAGFVTLPEELTLTPGETVTNDILEGTPDFLGRVRPDAITHEYVMEALRHRHPKVLFAGYGECDDWAHERRYDLSIFCCHHFDRYLKEIWEYTQSDPFYKDKTVFIVTTDHGRGEKAEQWPDHGFNGVPGSGDTWLMAFGKGIPAKGSLSSGEFHTNQIAPTLANWLGFQLPPHEGMGEPIDFDNL